MAGGGRRAARMSDTLQCPGGIQIPRLNICPELFLDRCIAFYGPSGTGKSVFVKDLMYELRGHVPQVIVVSPTEPSNRTYEGIVPPPLLHYSIGLGPLPAKETPAAIKARGVAFFNEIIKRQTALVDVYGRVNKLEHLQRLFGKIAPGHRARAETQIRALGLMRDRWLGEMEALHGRGSDRCQQVVTKAADKYKETLAAIYKRAIADNHAALWRQCGRQRAHPEAAAAEGGEHLTLEQEILTYIDLNPRLLLVLDDCAAGLKPFLNLECFRTLFYQGRHLRITSMFCLQDDVDLGPSLRKNVFFSFYMGAGVANSNFMRKANFTQEHTRVALEAVKVVFRVPYRKLVYWREDPTGRHFYYAIASEHPRFPFCTASLLELCREVGRGDEVDQSNAYTRRLMTQPCGAAPP